MLQERLKKTGYLSQMYSERKKTSCSDKFKSIREHFGFIVAQKLQFTSSVHKQNGVQWAKFLFPYFSYN